MKILYITTSLFRNESASLRNISLLNGLIENNIEVDVLTLGFNNEDKVLIDLLAKEVGIIKIPIPFFNKLHMQNKVNEKLKNKDRFYKIKKIIKDILFFPDTLSESIKKSKDINLKKYDYIVSSSDSKTSHFIAKDIILKQKDNIIPWIQIWGDPWQSDIGLSNIDFITRNRIKYHERNLIKSATKVFYISELTSNYIKKIYPEFRNKIEVLPRSYVQKIESKGESQNNIIFSYTGTILNRNLEPIISCIEEYNKLNKKKIELRFYGINEKLEILEKSFIKVYPRISFEKILKVYKNSDVLIYIDNLGKTTQIPGKIYDYFGTDKVILGLYENDQIKEYLEKFQRIEFYRNIKDKINLEKIIYEIGKKKILKEFSPKNVAKEFMNKIEEK